jgi:hypothetical protein
MNSEKNSFLQKLFAGWQLQNEWLGRVFAEFLSQLHSEGIFLQASGDLVGIFADRQLRK